MSSMHRSASSVSWQTRSSLMICLAIFFSLLGTLAYGQRLGKSPDRAVYQPPLLVMDRDGRTQLVENDGAPDLSPAPASVYLPKTDQSLGKNIRHSVEANQEKESVKLRSSSEQVGLSSAREGIYQHLPHKVVSETKRASGLLKAGEEGNLHRPLVEVGVDQADLQSMPIPSEKKMRDDSVVQSPIEKRALADYIRDDAPHGGPQVESVAEVIEEESTADGEILQATFENEAVEDVSKAEPEKVVDSVVPENDGHRTSLSPTHEREISLRSVTRFATWPLRMHRIGQEIAHDSTCDGCDHCESLSCDTIGCGIFGCDECESECDTLGCDAMGKISTPNASFSQRMTDLFKFQHPKHSSLPSGSQSNWFGGLDYMMVWRRGVRLPGLVTTEIANGTGVSEQVLVGDRIMTRMTSGFRFTTGRWMNKQQTMGFMGRGWYGGRKQFNFERNQSQTPTLLRPFLDFTDQFTPTPETQVIAEPGRADGSVVVKADSEAYGGDLAFRRFLGADYGATLDLLYGYQFVRFNERLGIQTNSVSLDDDFAPVGSTIAVRDSFQTSNEFHGAQIGLQTEYREDYWSFHGLVKVAFGSLTRDILREGETTVTVDGSTATEDEGLLVRQTNRGRITNQQFSWVPEINATLGWHRYEGWDLTLGYHLLAVSEAAHPGGAIDPELGVNLSDPLIGASRPTSDLSYRTFYLHGLHIGLQRVY